jgi:hypothetical protein
LPTPLPLATAIRLRTRQSPPTAGLPPRRGGRGAADLDRGATPGALTAPRGSPPEPHPLVAGAFIETRTRSPDLDPPDRPNETISRLQPGKVTPRRAATRVALSKRQAAA